MSRQLNDRRGNTCNEEVASVLFVLLTRDLTDSLIPTGPGSGTKLFGLVVRGEYLLTAFHLYYFI